MQKPLVESIVDSLVPGGQVFLKTCIVHIYTFVELIVK